MKNFVPILVIVTCAIVYVGFGCEEDEGECRIYLVEDGTGTIDNLHVVDSPGGENGDWGDNLINTVPEEYIEDDWRVFRFTAGRTLDHRLVYSIGGNSTEKENFGGSCDDGEGIKYEVSGGNMFTTYFNFD